MANIGLTMRAVTELLRLYFERDRNQREIADAASASTTTVWEYLRPTRLAGLSWPLPMELPPLDRAQPRRLLLFRRFVGCLPLSVHIGARHRSMQTGVEKS